ncbi:MAG TPA: septum formation family protein [Nocardioidaceae bacterium]|nr:septum formation family protein [Nocardioidaceae bacterium]
MRRLRIVAACAGFALALTSCGGGSTTPEAKGTGPDPTSKSQPTTRTVAPPAAPSVGDCRVLSYADISLYSNDSKSQPCSKPHTAFTFAVEQLPDDVAFDGVQIENDAVQSKAASACQDAYVAYIGGGTAERALTRLTVTYFVPKQAGFDAGAHWVRCDIVALKSDSSLADLPPQLEGFLDSGKTSDYDVCSRGDPSASGSSLVMCTQDHTYRAIAAIRLGESHATYPGEQATLSQGKQDCKQMISDLLGVSGGFTFSWTYPSTSDWSAGQRFGYCWNESTT